jgi:hypothetical protein
VDRLQPDQELSTGGQLVSPSGWLRLVLQDDGDLVLYRVQLGAALWSSKTDGQPVGRLVMQRDGNLVAFSPQGEPRWSTATTGNPGATAVLRDDGNFAVMSAAGVPLWSSHSSQRWDTPTVAARDGAGFGYVETSERWKLACRVLPCFTALRWPGYATAVVEDTIDGEPVVIQLWKGWCQKFLELDSFPGGIGAEVGVYRRMPGRVRPVTLPFLPPALEKLVLDRLSGATDHELWWPAPELATRVDFTMINPDTDEPFFAAGPQTTYWLTRWMDERSYLRWRTRQGVRAPLRPDGYLLEYTINGTTRRW